MIDDRRTLNVRGTLIPRVATLVLVPGPARIYRGVVDGPASFILYIILSASTTPVPPSTSIFLRVSLIWPLTTGGK